MNCCTCEFKEQIITQMTELRRANASIENQWIEYLFSPEETEADHSLCCLLTLLFYYGYCQENTQSVSDMARAVLKPLMETTESS